MNDSRQTSRARSHSLSSCSRSAQRCSSPSRSLRDKRPMLRVALDDIALEVAPGGCLAIAGPSGAGKTTLLRQIAGLAPARGRIECTGEVWLDTARGIDEPSEQRRVGFVFQDYALFPHMSALANVEFGANGS